MKVSAQQMEEVKKVAQTIEQRLEKPLTKEDLDEMDRKITEVLAELGHYKRFFKRLS